LYLVASAITAHQPVGLRPHVIGGWNPVNDRRCRGPRSPSCGGSRTELDQGDRHRPASTSPDAIACESASRASSGSLRRAVAPQGIARQVKPSSRRMSTSSSVARARSGFHPAASGRPGENHPGFLAFTLVHSSVPPKVTGIVRSRHQPRSNGRCDPGALPGLRRRLEPPQVDALMALHRTRLGVRLDNL
jgi:hypothetical protein